MIIDVYQDTVCPWCRIGKKNLLEAMDRWSETHKEPYSVRWHAFQLDPTTPQEGRNFKEVMTAKMGGEERLGQVIAHTCEAGKACSIDFNMDRIEYMPNTLRSHQLIALAPEEYKLPLIDGIYKAYFEDGRDIGKLDVLLELAKETGMGYIDALRKQMEDGAGMNEVEEDLNHASQIGITGVPFFIFNNKYSFSGAQSPEGFLKVLEMIEEKEKENA
ncbi:DsbA family oxidoreductase [Paenibacillus gansuensis]|uniref:DsbA family oxidoreductase n=1 Tax=Paenibacillus gansuensis TaxID=306542 RepID=A0ABW5PDR9_9BACL